MSPLSHLRLFLSTALRGMRQSPYVHAVAVLTLGLALYAVGLALGVVRWVDALSGAMGGEVELTVYLSEGHGQAQAEALSDLARRRSPGAAAAVVSPGEAMDRLGRQLGDLGAALEDLPGEPLPWSVEVRIPPEGRAPGALAALATELRALPAVSGVDYAEQAVTRLEGLRRALRFGGLLALLLVAGVTVVVVSATLQLAIYARREEIEIQKLVGATDAFVKAPFLIEGGLQGMLGAGLASAALWATGRLATPRAADLLAFLVGPSGLPRLDEPGVLLQLCVAGVCVGLLGSFVAVGRFLRV